MPELEEGCIVREEAPKELAVFGCSRELAPVFLLNHNSSMAKPRKRTSESPLVSRVLAAQVYEAESVEHAVQLAVRFKQDGRYDWFRGQTREWEPNSSVARFANDSNEFKKAQERLARLFYWIKKTSGLEDLAKNSDAMLAVAQHYGIPTPLLDFTTDPGVAGYFAALDSTDGGAEKGCIYCLSTTDIKRFWSRMRKRWTVFRDASDLDFITVNVPNLWRLEAQHGVFLFAPSNWSEFYVPDCIVFPQSGHLSYPTKDGIYPNRKSQLELLLDQFFMTDAFSGWHEMARSVFPDAEIFRVEAPPNRVEAEFFVRGKLPVLSCWAPKKLEKWQEVRSEPLRATALGEIALRVDLRAEPSVLRQRVAFGISRALEIDPTLRSMAVRWIVLPQKRLQEKLSRSLDWLWNGMRTLPYSTEDIAAAAGLCFALHRMGFADAENDDAEKIAASLMGEIVRLEFGAWDGSFARGFASANDLRKAARDDIEKFLLKQHRKHASFIQPLLQLCSSPKRLFPFKRLVRVFGRQIIPTQVLRPEGEAAFFSPVRLEGFGLP